MPAQTGIWNRTRRGLQVSGRSLLKRLMAGRYTFTFPNCQRVYTPWYEPRFLTDEFARVRQNTYATEDRCYMVKQFAAQCCHLEGEMAECGVYRGGTAYLIATAMREGRTTPGDLHLFDTFAGMPDTASRERDSHTQGDFGDVSLEAVSAFLSEFPFARLHPGFIPSTFAGLEDRRFAFVHIDVDIYTTTRDCLEFFYPRMVKGGVFLFDDYGFPIYERAEKQAADEFFSSRPEKPIALPTGEAIVIKL